MNTLRPQADQPSAFSALLNGEFDHATDGNAFEAWLNRIERLLEGRIGTPFGDALLMCDNAMMAFEEGVSADNYALQLQAMRGAI